MIRGRCTLSQYVLTNNGFEISSERNGFGIIFPKRMTSTITMIQQHPL